jgi:hypothetical protein
MALGSPCSVRSGGDFLLASNKNITDG